MQKIFKSTKPKGRRKDVERGLLQKQQPNDINNRKSNLHSPNITLNFGNRVPRWQLRVVAIIGVILQSAVLVLITLLTYHSRYIRKKLDSPVSDSAFELTLAGTLALLSGMFLCSWIIEQSTKETTWSSAIEFHLFWVQRDQAVNDQLFESYALFANNKRNSILTSRPVLSYCPDTGDDSPPKDDIDDRQETSWTRGTGARSRATKGAKMQKKRRVLAEDDRTSKLTELFALLATGTSISGFTLQFIGLRGMHWLATVAQMVAIALMTALRTWVRRDLAEKPFSKRLPKGFELDWLATRFASHSTSTSQSPLTDHDRTPPAGSFKFVFWQELELECQRREGTRKATSELHLGENDLTSAEFWGDSCLYWDIATDKPIDIQSKGLQGDVEINLLTAQNRMIKIRQRLSELTDWGSPMREEALLLSRSMEMIMNKLFSDPKSLGGAGRVALPLDVVFMDTPQIIHLVITREGPESKWKADETQVDAVLSLWLFAFTDGGIDELPGNRRIQLLGLNTVSLYRDCSWWIKENVNTIVDITKHSQNSMVPDQARAKPTVQMGVESHEFTGYLNGKYYGKFIYIRVGILQTPKAQFS